MTRVEIVKEIKRMPLAEQFDILEIVLQTVRENFQLVPQPTTHLERKQQMAEAAVLLKEDYETDEELTALTALDGEGFHA